jgi:hypothetical protein
VKSTIIRSVLDKQISLPVQKQNLQFFDVIFVATKKWNRVRSTGGNSTKAAKNEIIFAIMRLKISHLFGYGTPHQILRLTSSKVGGLMPRLEASLFRTSAGLQPPGIPSILHFK